MEKQNPLGDDMVHANFSLIQALPHLQNYYVQFWLSLLEAEHFPMNETIGSYLKKNVLEY